MIAPTNSHEVTAATDPYPWGPLALLVGKSVVAADVTTGRLVLSDTTVLQIQTANDDCCSFITLDRLNTVDSIITAVRVEDTDEGEGEYRAWIQVVTEAGELRLAEAEANASNGYYLHGFALEVSVVSR